MSKKNFRSAYDGIQKKSTIDCSCEPSITEQHHKQACDVNNIIKQYDKTGLITHVNNSTANYGDYSEINEYQVSLQKVIDANKAFEQIPSDIRKKFGNDAGLFFEYASNPDNAESMVEYGLAIKQEELQPTKVEIVEKAPKKGSSKTEEN